MRRTLVLAAAMLAAGCQEPAVTETQDNATATAPDYRVQVAALNERQRAGVLFRAIRDSGRDCQEITAVRAVPGERAAWAAVCDRRSAWVVALDAGGTATVTAAKGE